MDDGVSGVAAASVLDTDAKVATIATTRCLVRFRVTLICLFGVMVLLAVWQTVSRIK